MPFVQELYPEALAKLPKFCEYLGDEPSLRHLRGMLIETARVQEVIPAGDRDGIWVTEKNGDRWRPWIGVWITEVDHEGKPVPPSYEIEPIVERGPNAMSTGDLAKMGMTDESLRAHAKEFLGEGWEPDRPGPSDKRRELFDRVMVYYYGQGTSCPVRP